VVEVKRGVKRVDIKLDDVKTTLKAQVNEVDKKVNEDNKKVNEVDKKVDEVDKKVDEVKTQVEFLEKQIDNVRSSVNNGIAIQLNSLRKWLDDPIQPISAFVLIKDY